MTKDELQKEITTTIKALEDHSKTLASCVEVLRKTSASDVNFVALEQCKLLLESLPDVNVKGMVGNVRKALVARAKQRTKELSE